MTPAEVISTVLHNAELAEDVILALRDHGYEISEIRASAQDRLLADVRALVVESGIKQVAIARKLGVSQKHMSQILTGKVTLTLPWAEQIVNACGRSLEVRLGGDDRDSR